MRTFAKISRSIDPSQIRLKAVSCQFEGWKPFLFRWLEPAQEFSRREQVRETEETPMEIPKTVKTIRMLSNKH